MAANSNDKIQLKREEFVGNDVVLEDINPKSNTNSIIDDDNGLSLNETINRIWNAINNKLARYVNSVNGRTGVVVINASDVGLGNVDNVSYADIQDWVIKRIELEFENKRLHLFEYLDEAEAIVTNQDIAYKWTPFYSKRGLSSTGDLLSYIGFFAWNPLQEQLYYSIKAINVIGWADNSIIYNENIGDKQYSGGRIGVNIWQYEDALELYNAAGGAKNNSGLRIKKDKVANAVFFYNGCYGINADIYNPEANAFLDISSDVTKPSVSIIIDDSSPITATLNNAENYKLKDVIICNFDDYNYRDYDTITGINGPKDGVDTAFIDTQPKIGIVSSAPTPENPSAEYEITFYTIKPLVNFGLGYYTSASVLGVKPVVGKIDSTESSNDNLSGVNVIGNIKQNKDEVVVNEFNTVTPIGPTKTTYLNDDVDENVEGISDGLAIIPDMSMNVIPKNKFSGTAYIPNWPLKTAGNVDDKTGLTNDEKKITFLGVNLDKLIPVNDIVYSGDQISNLKYGYYDDIHEEFYVDPGFNTVLAVETTDTVVDINSGDLYHLENSLYESGSYNDGAYSNISELINTSGDTINLSGLRISKNTDSIVDDPASPLHTHSGGLSINTGKFVGIGNVDEVPNGDYYESGKLDVLVDETKGLKETGTNTNTLGVSLVDEGGLVFDVDGDIEVSLGMGMRLSMYDKTSAIDPTYDRKHITPSINDPAITEPTYDTHANTDDIRYFGGLRYIHSLGDDEHLFTPSYSTIGARINDWYDTYGEPIKHGTEGLKITPDNVLGVQPLENEVDINPIVIKNLEDFIEEYRGWTAVLPLCSMVFRHDAVNDRYVILSRDAAPSNWGDADTFYEEDDVDESGYKIIVFSGSGADLTPQYEKNKYYTKIPGKSDPRTAIINKYGVFGSKILKAERSYVVNIVDPVNSYTRRYVYVGDGVSAPSIYDYELQYEYFSSEADFDNKYPITYLALTSKPDDWDTNKTRYYKLESGKYVHVESVDDWDTGYYQLIRMNSMGKRPNRDKIYVIGKYNLIKLYTWGPKKTLYVPDVTGDENNHVPYDTDIPGITSNMIDKITADDASLILKEYNYNSSVPVDGHVQSYFNDEQRIRGHLAGSNMDTYGYSEDGWPQRHGVYRADDGSYALSFYTYASSAYSTYSEVKEQPDTWMDAFDHTDPANTLLDLNGVGKCFWRTSRTGSTPIDVYYLKTVPNGNYVSIREVYQQSFEEDTPVSFDTIRANTSYDGKVYVLTYVPDDMLTLLRSWASSNSLGDPAMKDELVLMPDWDLISVTGDTGLVNGYRITHVDSFDAGVAINIATTRGLDIVVPNINSETNSYGVAVKIYDITAGNGSALSNKTSGGLRYGADGSIAVRVNKNSEYDPDKGSGIDNLTTGTDGLKIDPKTNVLGIQVLPDCKGGLTLDDDGNVIMLGLIAMQSQPSDWGLHQENYFKLRIEPGSLSEDEKEYRRYHRKLEHFIQLDNSPAESFVPGKYYYRFAWIGPISEEIING